MALGPFAGEQVYDPQFEALVVDLCKRPGMFVNPVSVGAVCAYLDGFNAARSDGPLMGLQPWLVLRAGDGNNLHWSGLALRLLRPDAVQPADGEDVIRDLGGLIGQFLEYRRANGLAKVFRDYARWLTRRSWYTGPLRNR
ncbi:MAG TPA: hypothetical protein VM597_31500 [Gemmataceae bacterium]|nr:hypothetical protein [Gemmataceae bacterium]